MKRRIMCIYWVVIQEKQLELARAKDSGISFICCSIYKLKIIHFIDLAHPIQLFGYRKIFNANLFMQRFSSSECRTNWKRISFIWLWKDLYHETSNKLTKTLTLRELVYRNPNQNVPFAKIYIGII